MGVLLRDTDARDSRENLTEVSARLDVSEPGIPLPSSGRSEDAVVWVTTPEPRSTRRSTELLPESSAVPPTTLPAKLMPSRRTPPPWVDSLTTERSTKTSSSSREELWDPARDPSSSESPSTPPPRPGKPSNSILNSSTPPPSTDTEDSRPSRRRLSSSDPSRSRRSRRPLPPTNECDSPHNYFAFADASLAGLSVNQTPPIIFMFYSPFQ